MVPAHQCVVGSKQTFRMARTLNEGVAEFVGSLSADAPSFASIFADALPQPLAHCADTLHNLTTPIQTPIPLWIHVGWAQGQGCTAVLHTDSET